MCWVYSSWTSPTLDICTWIISCKSCCSTTHVFPGSHYFRILGIPSTPIVKNIAGLWWNKSYILHAHQHLRVMLLLHQSGWLSQWSMWLYYRTLQFASCFTQTVNVVLIKHRCNLSLTSGSLLFSKPNQMYPSHRGSTSGSSHFSHVCSGLTDTVFLLIVLHQTLMCCFWMQWHITYHNRQKQTAHGWLKQFRIVPQEGVLSFEDEEQSLQELYRLHQGPFPEFHLRSSLLMDTSIKITQAQAALLQQM